MNPGTRRSQPGGIFRKHMRDLLRVEKQNQNQNEENVGGNE